MILFCKKRQKRRTRLTVPLSTSPTQSPAFGRGVAVRAWTFRGRASCGLPVQGPPLLREKGAVPQPLRAPPVALAIHGPDMPRQDLFGTVIFVNL